MVRRHPESTETSPRDRSGPAVAYMTGEYLRISPFVYMHREICALREAGTRVETLSVRGLRPGDARSPEQDSEATRTYFLLPVSPFRLLKAHLRYFFRLRRYLQTLRLALRTRPPGLKGFFKQLAYFAETPLVANHLDEKQISHIHNHLNGSSCSVAMLAAHLHGGTFSFTVHGTDTDFRPDYWCLDEKVRRASFVVCISHFCRSQVMRFVAPESWNKLKIVHCGIDPDEFSQRNGAGRRRSLVFVGRLVTLKGLPVLLEALSSLKERHPDVRLTIVGDGPDRHALEQLVTRLELTEHVEFLGSGTKSDVRDQLARSDVLVLPSFTEGVPIVLMEAMAAQVPVVATHVGGVPELVTNGKNGLLVPPGSAADLTAAIDTLLQDAPLRQRLTAAAAETVARQFNSRIEARKLSSLFHTGAGVQPASRDATHARQNGVESDRETLAPARRLADEHAHPNLESP